jgi:hypothetical protein
MISTHESIGQSPSENFPLGDVTITPGALGKLDPNTLAECLARHRRGDWGDLDPEDRQANERALTSEGRLVSVYRTPSGVRFYIIKEHDRSRTTVLLPMEY